MPYYGERSFDKHKKLTNITLLWIVEWNIHILVLLQQVQRFPYKRDIVQINHLMKEDLKP